MTLEVTFKSFNTALARSLRAAFEKREIHVMRNCNSRGTAATAAKQSGGTEAPRDALKGFVRACVHMPCACGVTAVLVCLWAISACYTF